MGLSFPKRRPRLGSPLPQYLVFKVPATRICCKPQEAPHKGLREEAPPLQRAIRALTWSSYCHLLLHPKIGKETPWNSSAFLRVGPPSVTHLHKSAHSHPGKSPSALGAPLSEPETSSASPGTGVCDTGTFQALPQTSFSFFLFFKKNMLFWAYVHQFQNFLLLVHDREFCSVRRQGAGRPTETSANVVRLALLRNPPPLQAYTSHRDGSQHLTAAWQAKITDSVPHFQSNTCS